MSSGPPLEPEPLRIYVFPEEQSTAHAPPRPCSVRFLRTLTLRRPLHLRAASDGGHVVSVRDLREPESAPAASDVQIALDLDPGEYAISVEDASSDEANMDFWLTFQMFERDVACNPLSLVESEESTPGEQPPQVEPVLLDADQRPDYVMTHWVPSWPGVTRSVVYVATGDDTCFRAVFDDLAAVAPRHSRSNGFRHLLLVYWPLLGRLADKGRGSLAIVAAYDPKQQAYRWDHPIGCRDLVGNPFPHAVCWGTFEAMRGNVDFDREIEEIERRQQGD